jgi:hypothetical protein
MFTVTQVSSVDADKVKDVAKKVIKDEAIGIATSYFEKYFDVFELSIDSPEDLSSASILVVKGLSDPDDIKKYLVYTRKCFC